MPTWEADPERVGAERASLAQPGLTHGGKASLGRPPAADPKMIAAWRKVHNASIAAMARHFGVSAATVSERPLERFVGAEHPPNPGSRYTLWLSLRTPE